MAQAERVAGLRDCVRLGDAVTVAARLLRAARIDGAAREARWLTCEAAGLSRETVITRPDFELSPQALARLQADVRRRLKGEPVTRILGRREFYGREFTITSGVLDPRPDSEILIDHCLTVWPTRAAPRPLKVLDLGTGSGALVLTLLAEWPNAQGTAVDVSPAACTVAQANADALDVSGRCEIICANALEWAGGAYDVLISNPPYVRSADIATLDREVRDYDPQLALDGGGDGLDFYRQIAPKLTTLVPHGLCVFEVGAGMARDVAELMCDSLGDQVDQLVVIPDLTGQLRAVSFQTRTRA